MSAAGQDLSFEELLDGLRKARTLSDINIVAGGLHQDLQETRLRRTASRKGRFALMAAVLIAFFAFAMVFHPGAHLDHWGREAMTQIV